MGRKAVNRVRKWKIENRPILFDRGLKWGVENVGADILAMNVIVVIDCRNGTSGCK